MPSRDATPPSKGGTSRVQRTLGTTSLLVKPEKYFLFASQTHQKSKPPPDNGSVASWSARDAGDCSGHSWMSVSTQCGGASRCGRDRSLVTRAARWFLHHSSDRADKIRAQRRAVELAAACQRSEDESARLRAQISTIEARLLRLNESRAKDLATARDTITALQSVRARSEEQASQAKARESECKTLRSRLAAMEAGHRQLEARADALYAENQSLIEHSSDLSFLKIQVEEQRQRVDALTKESQEARAAMAQSEAAHAECVSSMKEELEAHESRAAATDGRIKHLESERDRAIKDMRQRRWQVVVGRALISASRNMAQKSALVGAAELRSAKDRVSALESELESSKIRLQEQCQAIASIRKRLSEAKAGQSRAEQRAAEAQLRAAKAEEELAGIQRAHTEATSRLSALESRAVKAESGLSKAQEALKHKEETSNDIKLRADQAESRANQAKSESTEARATLVESRKRVTFLEARVAALEAAARAADGKHESKMAVLSGQIAELATEKTRATEQLLELRATLGAQTDRASLAEKERAALQDSKASLERTVTELRSAKRKLEKKVRETSKRAPAMAMEAGTDKENQQGPAAATKRATPRELAYLKSRVKASQREWMAKFRKAEKAYLARLDAEKQAVRSEYEEKMTLLERKHKRETGNLRERIVEFESYLSKEYGGNLVALERELTVAKGRVAEQAAEKDDLLVQVENLKKQLGARKGGMSSSNGKPSSKGKSSSKDKSFAARPPLAPTTNRTAKAGGGGGGASAFW